jgi:hypothetical protein
MLLLRWRRWSHHAQPRALGVAGHGGAHALRSEVFFFFFSTFSVKGKGAAEQAFSAFPDDKNTPSTMKTFNYE